MSNDPAFSLAFSTDESARLALDERASRMISRGPPETETPLVRAIQFLRGVASRATFALPAFYLYLGAQSSEPGGCAVSGYPGVVLRYSLDFSSLGTVALACRKVFDHEVGGLSGANFAKMSDQTLTELAEYWADSRGCELGDALAALELLRSLFRACSNSPNNLLRSETLLQKRVGLLKQYVDRNVGHLTLQNYEVAALDVAHVVAALVMVGAIITSFDRPNESHTYFDELDVASHAASRNLFPDLPALRLFERFSIAEQSKAYWRWEHSKGLEMLLDRLPYAIGWF